MGGGYHERILKLDRSDGRHTPVSVRRRQRRNEIILNTRFTNFHPRMFLLSILIIIASASGLSVNSVLFSAPEHGSISSPKSSSQHQQQQPLIVFIHGRLEVDPSSGTEKTIMEIPSPEILYSEFCTGLARTISTDVLLVDYHKHYKDWSKEPRDLGLGPVSSAIGEAIQDYVTEAPTNNRGKKENPPISKITLISFSMGAAIVLKLLKSSPLFNSSSTLIELGNIVLVEPVWRCWLPSAVSKATEVKYSSTLSDSLVVSKARAIALVGSNDNEVRDDSGARGENYNLGRIVGRSLESFLPNLSVVEVDGGNHFGLCSGPYDISEFAAEGLGLGKHPVDFRNELIGHIEEFCSSRGK